MTDRSGNIAARNSVSKREMLFTSCYVNKCYVQRERELFFLCVSGARNDHERKSTAGADLSASPPRESRPLSPSEFLKKKFKAGILFFPFVHEIYCSQCPVLSLYGQNSLNSPAKRYRFFSLLILSVLPPTCLLLCCTRETFRRLSSHRPPNSTKRIKL